MSTREELKRMASDRIHHSLCCFRRIECAILNVLTPLYVAQKSCLLLTLLFGVLPCSADYFTVDNIRYYWYKDNDYVSVNKCYGEPESLIIPSHVSYNGITRPVEEIGTRVFINQTQLKNVSIPDTVRLVGTQAFSFCNDELYDIVNGVRVVDGWVVASSDIASGELEISGVKGFEFYALDDCDSISKVFIHDGVRYLGYGAFMQCNALTNVWISDSVIELGAEVFWGCNNLVSVRMPSKLTRIEASTFRGCRELTEFLMPSNIQYIGNSAFESCGSLRSISLPESMSYIGSAAFMYCTGIDKIEIPRAVEKLGYQAFDYCGTTEFYFKGPPPLIVNDYGEEMPEERYGNVLICHYEPLAYFESEHREAWLSEIDENGCWHGFRMQERKDVFTISYNSNGGAGNIRDFLGESGGDGVLVDDGSSLHWEGHYFMGWALAPDGEVVYRAGDYVAEPTDGDTVTLYAVWSLPALTLTPVDADWRIGSILFKCEDADTSGTAHTYSLAYSNQVDDVWVLADGDAAKNVSLSSDGCAHLSDTKFASRNNGVGSVKYRVMDETGRTAECFTRERHALYIALDVYENDWQKDLSQPKISSPSYLMNVFLRACERYGRVGGYSQPLANENATTNAIQSQLNYMATYVTEPGDAVLVYYCGHGANEWLTCYGQNEKLTKTDLFNALDAFPQGVGIVVVIDACHSTSMIEKGITEDNRIAWITAALKDEYSSSDYFSTAFCEDGWFNGLADNSTTIGNMDGYVSFWELAKYAQLEMAKDYSRHKQICTFWNDDMLKNMVAGRSLTSSKTDRIFRWLTKHTSAFSSTGSNMEVAVATTAANGIHTIADCYELGIDPDNPDDDFRITHFEMVNGEPVFELNHTTDGSGESFLPRIKKLGKADLKDNWSEVPPGGDPAHRFFTVEVMKGE